MSTKDAEVIALYKQGISYREIQDRLSLTRGQVAGVIFRHRRPDRAAEYLKQKNPLSHEGHPHAWSDAALTEPWVEYHARKRAERGQARN